MRKEGGRIPQRAQAQGEIDEARADLFADAVEGLAAEESGGALAPEGNAPGDAKHLKVIERTLYTVREEGTGKPLLGTKQLQFLADEARQKERQHLTRLFGREGTVFAAERAALEGQVRILTRAVTNPGRKY